MATKKKAPAPKKPLPLKRYRVELKHSPTREVEAVSEGKAWEAYKKSCGLIRSEWEPVITDLDAEPEDEDQDEASDPEGDSPEE